MGGEHYHDSREQAVQWRRLLEGGLLDFHNDVYEQFASELRSPKKIKKEFRSFLADRKYVVMEEVAGPRRTTDREFVMQYKKYSHTLVKKESERGEELTLHSENSRTPKPERLLVDIGNYARWKINRMFTEGGMYYESTNKTQEALLHWTDLGDAPGIVLDNVDTYMQVFQLAIRGCKTIPSAKRNLRKLVRGRNAYRYKHHGRVITLNPHRQTNLELMARAPFRFWGALSDKYTIVNANEKPVLSNSASGPLFNSEFIFTITRSNFAHFMNLTRFMGIFPRRGGCPALHPQFADTDIINKYGELFLRLYTMLSKETPR